MDTPKVMAIDLPEIRTAMGQFLGTSDLAIAAMVCRSWNASFTPILYSVINWSTRGKNPSRESIIANAGYIRRLDLTIGTYTKDGEFWYSDRQLRFQSLRWLYLVVESSLSARHQIEIIRKCPELKELNWYNFGSMSSLGSNSYVSSCLSPTMFQVVDVSELFAMHCPNVERLTLHGGARSDEDLSRILDNCRRVTELTATPSSFKELTIRSLSRHFEHIERLDINRSGLTSKMAQHILTNCPNLNYFHGVTLEAQDILGATEYNVMGVEHPQAWVCSRLASLTIFICGLDKKPRDWHRRVFHQLSKMKRLVSLTIGPGSLSAQESCDGLDLRLDAGLYLLSSLRRLRIFSCKGLQQQMEEQDVRWMVKSWRKLTVLLGALHHDYEQWQEMKPILSESTRITHY